MIPSVKELFCTPNVRVLSAPAKLFAYREGPSKAWRLDLAMPAEQTETSRPALVIVYGGGWRGGSKSVDVYQKMMTDYAANGYVTINVEYGLTGETPFPACIEVCIV